MSSSNPDCQTEIFFLIAAIASGSMAAFLIFEAEEQFRQHMILYDRVLSQADALDLMAAKGCQLAEIIMEEEYGLSLTVPPRLMKRCLLAAIRVVKDDYSAELDATLAALEAKL